MAPLFQTHKTAKLITLTALGVLLVIIFLYTSGSVEPSQFRGIGWGSGPTSVSGLELMAEQGDLKFYERKGEKMQVEGLDVDKIVYGFHKERFYSAMAYFSGAETFTRFKEKLGRQYNESQLSQDANRVFWNGTMTSLLLTFDPPSNTGRISYFFKPVQLEAEMGADLLEQHPKWAANH